MEVSSALIPQFSSVEAGPPLLLSSFGSACGSAAELLTPNADCLVVRDLVGKEEGEATISNRNINSNSNHVHIYEADSSGIAVLANIQAHSAYSHLPMDLFAGIPPSQQQQQSQHQQLGGAALDLTILQQQQHQASPPPQLNAPTMHPNLVSTLKSIISSSRGQTEEFVLQQESSSCHESMADAVRDDRPSTALGLRQLHTRCNTAPAASAGVRPSLSQRKPDDRQAAIVPVDLIRNRRPFKCGFSGCNKTFKNPQTLRMHRKTHCVSSSGSSSEEGRSRGGSRGQAFHSLATVPPSCKAGHNKKIPSRCPICNRSFVGLYELRRHFGRKHSEGEKSHACSKCDKRFYIEVDLRDHEKLCGEPLVCKCGIKFAFKCNLVAHKKTHPSCQDPSPPPPPSSAPTLTGSLVFPPFPAQLPLEQHLPPLSSMVMLQSQPAASSPSASLTTPTTVKSATPRSWCMATAPPPSSDNFQLSTVSSSEGCPAANASWLSSAAPGVGPVIM